MRIIPKMSVGRRRGSFFIITALMLAFSIYIEQVVSLPADATNEWPTFPRRNIEALARGGYVKNAGSSYKRSISTLAKNGMLPTYRSPYVETDKPDQDDEQAQDKRNIASIARLRSYSDMKRNIQALARDGYRIGRGQYNVQNEKRNIAALACNGMIHKRDELNGEEYFYPFYQNQIPPLSEIAGPYDLNEIYDFQQSVNPDLISPISQVFKRNALESSQGYFNQKDDGNNWYFKRSYVGLPAQGLYRPMYINPTVKTKRYILPLPDVIDTNDINDKTDSDNEDKRSVGNIPLTRISELGNISLVPKFGQSIQTTPTYRRRQYLLTRTRPAGTSTER